MRDEKTRRASSLARNLPRGVSTRIFETRHPRHRASFRLSRSILFSAPPLSTPRKHSDPPSPRAPPFALLAPQNPSSSLLPFYSSLLPGVRKPSHYVSPPLPPSRQIRKFRPHRARLAAVQHTARLLTFVTRSRTPLVHYHHHLPRAAGKVLVITSRKRPNNWVLPKGGWEPTDGVLEAAASREALEEAGVRGKITRFVTTIPSASSTYHFYELDVADLDHEWLESKERRREWVDYAEAVRRLSWKAELAQGLSLSTLAPKRRVKHLPTPVTARIRTDAACPPSSPRPPPIHCSLPLLSYTSTDTRLTLAIDTPTRIRAPFKFKFVPVQVHANIVESATATAAVAARRSIHPMLFCSPTRPRPRPASHRTTPLLYRPTRLMHIPPEPPSPHLTATATY
ncbi:hypothetical protein VTO73DRAFT_8206 [Trametes versicolor]